MSSFEETLSKWIALDNNLKELNESVKDIREKKANVASTIHRYVTMNDKFKDANINISNGRLKLGHIQTTQALTFKYIEECLTDMISDKSTIEQIMVYLKKKRTVKSIPDIKRFYD